ncbi:EAL domain-containing protein [Hyphomicrobium sp.]|uniref:putative bifunctional diguanylate cyclase/phosphodiesterase n=1 Tax=Hyphomicrobium sp. TaxID=82 RepID=UPI0025B7DF49|nr:EAL domain-containing protein [Hyphomicrobium sp.]MCC7252576.1 EAL domain-containing protein [Hyphomicrobium sp.]
MPNSRIYRSARPALATGAPRTGQPLRVLAIGSLLTVLSAALLVTGGVWWSTTRADQAAKDRQFQTVSYALTTSAEKISYDQESVAYWDEAVINTRNAFDEKWVDVNLGVWMYDYFKHDRVAVLDANDNVLYAMADGKQTTVGDRAPNAAVASLAAQLRQRIATGALDNYEAGKTRIPRVDDVGFVDGRPAAISVMVLVPHSNAVVQARGTECLIASVRFLDSSFLTDLANAHFLDSVRFSGSGDIAPDEQSYPLTTKGGEVLGSFVWTPKLAGARILSEVLPVLAAGLVVISLAIAFLIRQLRQTYTELVTSEAHATHLALHDTLTGLPNRAFLNERLDDALNDVRQGRGQLALVFLDLDRFKQVNDSLGHAAGDALICELAGHLTATLKAGNVLARMGGDEFAIVMRDIKGRVEVEALCRDIVAVVSRPFDVLGGQAMVGISIGVAIAPTAGLDRSELARKADIALYQAKRSGGQHFEFFTEDMSHTVQQRRDLEIDLRRALETGNELEVVFQPICAARDLELSGVEALLRWTHPRIGAVSPYTFIGLAEDCGVIDQLGDLVLRRACAVAGAWAVDTVSVNVSAIQLRQNDFAERVLALLDETGMPPTSLDIEITESTLIGGSEASGRNLKALRAAGVKISLDDFGTGYSSLSYLMKLEVDRIKIDRSFVRHLGESAQSESIVQAIVTMAHAVGVTVTAEGVETREQQDFLVDIGCNHLQGYLLSPPLSALRMVEFIAGNGVPCAASSSDTAAA